MILKLFALITIALLPSISFADCDKWFNNSKLDRSSKNCLTSCVSLTTDLSTIECPGKCADLCKIDGKSGIDQFLFYPGLTKAERKLISENPKESAIVFVQKERAEYSTARNFPDGEFNDESDAYRHFVWAALLVAQLGEDRAKLYLDAHEDNLAQPVEEKAMDQANNRNGLLIAARLKRDNQLDIKTIEKAAINELRAGNMSVLRPRLKIPKEPK